MDIFHKLTIKNRLVSIILLVTLLATGSLFTIQTYLDIRKANAELLHQTKLLATLVSQNSVIPLAFSDAPAAESVLMSLHPISSIIAARVTMPDGTILASYGDTTILVPDIKTLNMDGTQRNKNFLFVYKPISKDEILGHITLVASRAEIITDIRNSIIVSIIIYCLIILLAYWAAVKVQGTISEPIINLTRVANTIATQKDYSVRAQEDSGGEIGQLQKSINTMVSMLHDTIESLQNEISERQRAAHEKDMLEEKLRHAERLKALGRMSGGIAHDFNNQLVGIMGYASFLQTKLRHPEKIKNFEKLQKYTKKILETAEQYSELIKKLLIFSRQSKSELRKLHIDAVLQEVIAIARMSCGAHITIEKQLECPDALIMGDKVQLHNAFLNLALNARDAMPTPGTLTFSSELFFDGSITETSQLTQGVKVSVSDTGIGMEAEVKKHIFEPFYSTKDIGKGTGLGLASVYGTVKSHHGKIKVHSEKGKGTVFSIFLPFNNKELQTPVTQSPKERSHGD